MLAFLADAEMTEVPQRPSDLLTGPKRLHQSTARPGEMWRTDKARPFIREQVWV